MTYVAGYKAKVYVSDDNSTFVELKTEECTLSFNGEIIDVTTLGGNGWRSKLQGLKDWTISVTPLFESGNSGLDILRDAFFTGDGNLYIRYDIDGTSSNRVSGIVMIESQEMPSNLSDAQKMPVSLQGNGAPTVSFA